ncbi:MULTISPECIES: YueI family protein [Bacillaceae]|uniref:YueI family protein n=1 Tax=Bacillaceae TaxID=186817 RepID=UPI001E4E694D|nr:MULTISPECIES: YueI family protein [Bacillaceae]MCE4049948.1 YueI family protein [Bacillus sp. Au-Bac7]MDL0436914.1 YueI family protein [Niallia sp. SS-2023]UPO88014.1 YueI family protein [Niallia sp. Man26]
MTNPNLDDYLQQGMYGTKETKPEERRQFLGTIRERIVLALRQSQVREPDVYKEAEEAIKGNKGAKLYLNGHLDYSYLSKYLKIANQQNMEYTIVTNNDYNSDIGLLIAYDHAVDKEDIYVTENSAEKKADEPKEKKGFFAKLFKR